MLQRNMFNTMMRKNKNFKIMEMKNWNEELEENVDFIYFTYNVNKSNFIHVMVIVVYLENEIQIEFIQQEKGNIEVEALNRVIYEMIEDKINNDEAQANKKIVDTVDRERFKKYVYENEKLKKKMERYIKD